MLVQHRRFFKLFMNVHRITKTEEAIPFFDRMLIRVQDVLTAGERSD
jgi:hypothetical protein